MKKLRTLVAALLCLWLAVLIWIDRSGQRVDVRKVDCIVILGSRALADGTPGESLKARTERAVQLYREGWAAAIVCTGGRGQSGSVESDASRSYAIAQGVPAAAVITESESHNTRENFAYAAPLMLQRGWKNCLVVTDPFHEPRALALARDYGLEPYPAPSFGGPATQRWGSRLFYTARESFSWIKYSLQRLTGAGKRKEAPLARVPSNMEEPEYPVGFGAHYADDWRRVASPTRLLNHSIVLRHVRVNPNTVRFEIIFARNGTKIVSVCSNLAR